MNGHPIEWKGKTLTMSPLTADIKATFAKWVEPRYIRHAREMCNAPGLDEQGKKEALAEYQLARQEVFGGGIAWTTTPHFAVAIAFNTPEGELYLHRLLFGSQVSDWTDDQLREFLDAKDKDEASDYRVAWDIIWDTQDPKAKKGSEHSPAPVATPSLSEPSAESHSREFALKMLGE